MRFICYVGHPWKYWVYRFVWRTCVSGINGFLFAKCAHFQEAIGRGCPSSSTWVLKYYPETPIWINEIFISMFPSCFRALFPSCFQAQPVTLPVHIQSECDLNGILQWKHVYFIRYLEQRTICGQKFIRSFSLLTRHRSTTIRDRKYFKSVHRIHV